MHMYKRLDKLYIEFPHDQPRARSRRLTIHAEFPRAQAHATMTLDIQNFLCTHTRGARAGITMNFASPCTHYSLR